MTNIAVKLSDSLKSFGVGTAYGEPIDVDGKKIVPIALVHFGFGGGGNDTDSETGRNSGASGADSESGPDLSGGVGYGCAIPIGAYITNTEDEVEFQPNVISLIAVSIPFVWASGWAIAKVIRALKK